MQRSRAQAAGTVNPDSHVYSVDMASQVHQAAASDTDAKAALVNAGRLKVRKPMQVPVHLPDEDTQCMFRDRWVSQILCAGARLHHLLWCST